MNGEIKYLENGQEVIVIEELKGGRFLVSHVYENYDSEPYIGGESIVSRVYDTPPVAKIATAITNKQKELEELKDVLSEYRKKIDEAQKEWKEVSKYKPTQNLLDFIRGNITHYVVLDQWDLAIVGFKDEVCDYDKRKLKLLTLFGDSKGDLSWNLSMYSDGSGSRKTVIPCTSYEQAVDELQEFLDSLENIYSYRAIEAQEKYGVKIKQELLDRFYEEKKKNVQERRDQLKKDLDKMNQQLKELEENNSSRK